MADGRFKIVCVDTEHAHRHIVSVGIEQSDGVAMLSVTQVRDMIDADDTFFTVSPSTDKVALVRKDRCTAKGCDIKTIRSVGDVVKDNNLDEMAPCD